MTMLAPHALQPGSRLGRYELARFLGEGGFAEVWLGRSIDHAEPREVALKVLRRGRFGTVSDRAMFFDEANIALSLRHPNVARVFEVGGKESAPFLVMEYVSGGSLDLLQVGARAMGEPVPIAIGTTLVLETCRGLHAAHELVMDGRPQHVVHRDVSPQNILITEQGVPKLIDFGIAKARERISKATTTGIAKGKITYMSPEQARGERLDRRADVWAIAAVLFELLEGRPMLTGPNEIARAQLLVSRPMRPVFERTPMAIASVIRRAVAFHPEERHATIDELRVELEKALAVEGLAASTDEIARYCARARRAAAPATVIESGIEEAYGSAAPATLPVRTREPRSRRAVALALTFVVIAVGLGVGTAMRMAARTRASIVPIEGASSASSPATVLAEAPPPSAPPVAPAAPASSPAQPAIKRTPAAAAPAVRAAFPTEKRSAKASAAHHPSDYAQIE